jgi:hypothetical protein
MSYETQEYGTVSAISINQVLLKKETKYPEKTLLCLVKEM